MARRESLEGSGRFLVLRQRPCQISWYHQWLVWLRRFPNLHSLLVQLGRRFDPAHDRFIRRQVRQLGDVAQRSARPIPAAADDERRLPENEIAVLLERGHPAENALVIERRSAPPQGFVHLGAGLVDQIAKMGENRTCEFSRL